MNDDAFTGYESAFVPTASSEPVNQDETPQKPININNSQPVRTGPYNEVLRRNIRKNPLSQYSSYTYNLSIYMISPDAYDVFVRNGRKDIEIVNQAGSGSGGGAYLIVRSGGINNQEFNRAPGFHYDMYIDNLIIKSTISPSGTSAPTTNFDMSFTLYEPYGFSFISNLKRAKDSLDAYSATLNIKDSSNTSRQFFVIGIEFMGYDADGNVISGSGPSQTFKRYYDIVFTKIDFKIDGRMTTYQIKAVPIPVTVAMGQKRGVIDKGANQITGTSVQELLNKLCEKITKDQTDDVNAGNREFANTYAVKFIDNASDIAQSSIVTKSDLDKIKWPMANVKSSLEVNPGIEVKSNPNSQARTVAFNRDTPVIQAIQQIVNQSTYLIDSLKAVYNTDAQPNKEGNKEQIDSNKRAKWFNISTLVKSAKFDRKIRDFAYDIIYEIRTYETPVVVSVAADNVSPYYGPFKRYDYWYTGQNTEIIGYEQTMNNAYFTVAIDTMGNITPSQGTGGKADIPIAVNKRTPLPRTGKLDLGMEAQNNYITSLVDPGAYAKAKIRILGDPDLLSNDMPSGNPDLEASKPPFFGVDGYSLDPRTGQAFIEVDFKEAVDYENSTGLLRTNENIIFWEYPPNIQKMIKGICYQIINIESRFSQGRFTQELEVTLATFGDSAATPYSQSEQGRQESQQIADNEAEIARLSSAQTVGLLPEKTVGSSSGGDPGAVVGRPTTAAVNVNQTNSRGVADDDATKPNGPPTPVTKDLVPKQEDVNTRVRIGLGLQEGRESQSLINRARSALGIPIGGTRPGG